MDNIQTVLKACYDKGTEIVSVFAWSTENWSRPHREVSYIMHALEKHLPRLVKALHEKNIRFNHLGSMERLSSQAQKVLKCANHFTEKKGPLTFNLAFNYGGRNDIIHSLKMIVAKKIPSDMITQATIDKFLYTAGLPDIDLLIRSGGEVRVSNFMLWQAATAYIYFTDTYWPEIGESEIDRAIIHFNHGELYRTSIWPSVVKEKTTPIDRKIVSRE